MEQPTGQRVTQSKSLMKRFVLKEVVSRSPVGFAEPRHRPILGGTAFEPGWPLGGMPCLTC
jgi:hypothetical protein